MALRTMLGKYLEERKDQFIAVMDPEKVCLLKGGPKSCGKDAADVWSTRTAIVSI